MVEKRPFPVPVPSPSPWDAVWTVSEMNIEDEDGRRVAGAAGRGRRYSPQFSEPVMACSMRKEREGMAPPVYLRGSCTVCSEGGTYGWLAAAAALSADGPANS